MPSGTRTSHLRRSGVRARVEQHAHNIKVATAGGNDERRASLVRPRGVDAEALPVAIHCGKQEADHLAVALRVARDGLRSARAQRTAYLLAGNVEGGALRPFALLLIGALDRNACAQRVLIQRGDEEGNHIAVATIGGGLPNSVPRSNASLRRPPQRTHHEGREAVVQPVRVRLGAQPDEQLHNLSQASGARGEPRAHAKGSRTHRDMALHGGDVNGARTVGLRDVNAHILLRASCVGGKLDHATLLAIHRRKVECRGACAPVRCALAKAALLVYRSTRCDRFGP